MRVCRRRGKRPRRARTRAGDFVASLRAQPLPHPVSIVALCRDRLAGYKRPKTIEWREELPRSMAGKLLKRQLRAPYWEGTGRSI